MELGLRSDESRLNGDYKLLTRLQTLKKFVNFWCSAARYLDLETALYVWPISRFYNKASELFLVEKFTNSFEFLN